LTIKVNDYIYPVTVSELKSVLSRSTNLSEDEIEALIDYLPEINVAVPEVNMDKIINNAIEIAVSDLSPLILDRYSVFQ
jgi:hypothetical protein